MATNNLVAKIWSFCDTLRDDGLGYGDYLEQLTFLLFLNPKSFKFQWFERDGYLLTS